MSYKDECNAHARLIFKEQRDRANRIKARDAMIQDQVSRPTAEALGKIFFEELDKDSWGHIAPYEFLGEGDYGSVGWKQ